jgi:CheY-like chemotaxis protein
MTPEVRRSVLQPFFTTKPKGVGTGLGLSVSHQIIVEHGGRLQIDTCVGQGTTFELGFPVAGPRNSYVSALGPATVPRKTRHKRLLIIERDPEVRAAMSRLARQNHEVFGVAGWEEARRLLDDGHEMDAILCDTATSNQDARAIYQGLLKKNLDLAARLVFCTGDACPPGLRQFMASIPNQRLEKPFTERELDACLQSMPPGRFTSL